MSPLVLLTTSSTLPAFQLFELSHFSWVPAQLSSLRRRGFTVQCKPQSRTAITVKPADLLVLTIPDSLLLRADLVID